MGSKLALELLWDLNIKYLARSNYKSQNSNLPLHNKDKKSLDLIFNTVKTGVFALPSITITKKKKKKERNHWPKGHKYQYKQKEPT